MAGCPSKREELLRLIPDLQCHKCKNVPGPNGNQKNRYSCTGKSLSEVLILRQLTHSQYDDRLLIELQVQ